MWYDRGGRSLDGAPRLGYTCPTVETVFCFVKDCVYRYQVTCVPWSVLRGINDEATSREDPRAQRDRPRLDGPSAPPSLRVWVSVFAKEKDEVNARLREAIIIKKR